MGTPLHELMNDYTGGAKIDFSGVPLKNVAVKSRAMSEAVRVSVEIEAQEFYLYQHAIHAISGGLLPSNIVGYSEIVFKYFHDFMRSALNRSFHYLLLITHREARHLEVIDSLPLADDLIKEEKEITKECHNKDYTHAYKVLGYYNGDITLGRYTRYLVTVFNEGKWSSKAFGGQKWGAIATVLNDYVHGKITGVEFLDTVFTLSHNNGAIFNKNVVYLPHKNNEFLTILDVQRAGMIPQYIQKESPNHKELMPYLTSLREHVGVAFDGVVDWYKVEELGAVQKYDYYKSQMNKDVEEVEETIPKSIPDPYEKYKTGKNFDFYVPKKDGTLSGNIYPIISEVF